MRVNSGVLLVFAYMSATSLLAHSTELNIESNKPATSTYVQGELVEMRFRVSGANHEAFTTLTYEIVNENGNTVIPERRQKIEVDGRGDGEFVAALPSDRMGYYSIVATLDDRTATPSLGTRPNGVFSYAVVIDPAMRRDYGDQLSRFGLQGGFNRDVNVIPLLGVRYVFQQGADWASAEERYAGQFRENIDRKRRTNSTVLRNKSDVENINYKGQKWDTYVIALITQGKFPKWAIDPSTLGKVGVGLNFSSIAPNKRQAFSDFAAAHAQEVSFDYPNQASHLYQVTWEPMFPDCYGGTSEQLVDMYKLAYESIHEHDNRAKVAGPTLILYKKSEQQLRELLNAGMTNYIDVFSLHAYEESDKWPLETSGFREDLRRQLSLVKSAAHKDVPFISTEHGFQSQKYGLLNQALANVRSSIILLGEGAQSVTNFYVADFWNKDPRDNGQSWGFYWNLNPRLEFGTDKVGPKPIVPAYAAMTYILDGTVSDGSIDTMLGSQMGYHFTRGKMQILVLWDYLSESPLTLNAGTREINICDWMGNCVVRSTLGGSITLQLNSQPLYVIGNYLSVAAQK